MADKDYKNNFYPIQGVIYSKPVRTAEGREGTINAGKTFEFPSIVLEVKRDYKGTTYTELPEFELGRGVNIQDFDKGDRVEILFSLSGKSIKSKTGKDPWHKTTAKALYIRHMDIVGNDTRSVGADFKSKKKEEAPLEIPSPYDENTDDLPF